MVLKIPLSGTEATRCLSILKSPYRDSVFEKIILKFAYADFFKVKKAGGKCGICFAVIENIGKIRHFTGAARCNDRNIHGLRNKSGKFKIKARFRAVFVHACK